MSTGHIVPGWTKKFIFGTRVARCVLWRPPLYFMQELYMVEKSHHGVEGFLYRRGSKKEIQDGGRESREANWMRWNGIYGEGGWCSLHCLLGLIKSES